MQHEITDEMMQLAKDAGEGVVLNVYIEQIVRAVAPLIRAQGMREAAEVIMNGSFLSKESNEYKWALTTSRPILARAAELENGAP